MEKLALKPNNVIFIQVTYTVTVIFYAVGVIERLISALILSLGYFLFAHVNAIGVGNGWRTRSLKQSYTFIWYIERLDNIMETRLRAAYQLL